METYLKIAVHAENTEYLDTNKFEDFEVSFHTDIIEGGFNKNKSDFFTTAKSACDFQQNESIYFAPGVTIPRVKMKNIYNEFGVKSVRDIENADKVFVGGKTHDLMVEHHWYYAVKTDAFKHYVSTLEVGVNVAQYYLDKVNTALEFYTNDWILVDDWSSVRLLTQYAFVPGMILNEDYNGSKSFYYVKSEYTEIYKELITKDMYSEDSLLKYINGTDAVVIDETMYNTLCTMFGSGDSDNAVVAMEIMANSNYFESLVFILMLFEEYGNKISDQRSRNHVNFKALCSYLDIYPNSIYMDDIVKIMLRKNAVTMETMSILLKKYDEDIINRGNTTYFKVQAVTFSDEISQILGKQIVKRTEIFTPKPKEDAFETGHAEFGY